MNEYLTTAQFNSYLSAEYVVHTPVATINIPIGKTSQEMTELQASYHVTGCAFITAYNPHSQLTNEIINVNNQKQLVADTAKQWECLPGIGLDPQGQWPDEPSILIMGISLTDALNLARQYQQNAIVFVNKEGIAQVKAASS